MAKPLSVKMEPGRRLPASAGIFRPHEDAAEWRASRREDASFREFLAERARHLPRDEGENARDYRRDAGAYDRDIGRYEPEFGRPMPQGRPRRDQPMALDGDEWGDWFATDTHRRADSLARRLMAPAFIIASILVFTAAAGLVLIVPLPDPPPSITAAAPQTGETVFVASATAPRAGVAEAPAPPATAPDLDIEPTLPQATPATTGSISNSRRETAGSGGTTWLEPRRSGAAAATTGFSAVGRTATEAGVGDDPVSAASAEPAERSFAASLLAPLTPGEPTDTGPATGSASAFRTAATEMADTSVMEAAIETPEPAAEADDVGGPSMPGRVAHVTTDVNMRAGPANEEVVIAVVPAEAAVELFGCEFWCEVVYGGRLGWIYKDFIDETVALAISHE